MANYRALVRHFPSALEYLRQARWIRRGDVLAYAPLLSAETFSTDAFGFRHTWFAGRNIGLDAAAEHSRIGLVFGSSHVFGFALEHNRETLPSRLSALAGFPFFGISYPEADSRTLHATFSRLAAQHGGRIGPVVLITGGDFTRYCYVELADPLFGPPFLPSKPDVTPRPDAARHFANLVQFTQLWSARFAETAAALGTRFVLLDDVTFFEKPVPDAVEQACALGTPHDEGQRRRFAAHHAHALTFQAERRRFASESGIALAPFPEPDRLLFIDEFHYRAETQGLIAQTLAPHLL
jgi:hypothetical protein